MNCKKCRKVIPDESIYCMWCGRKQVAAERVKRRPNGAGTVFKEKGARAKPWRARVLDGKHNITIGYFSTQSEAYKALAVYEPQGSVVRSDMTLEEVYNAWGDVKCEIVSDSARDGYKAAWRRMQPLKDLPISEIKTADYQVILDEIKKDRSRSTCEKFRGLASQLCQWAMQNDLIDKNYAEFLVLPAQKETGEREYFTEEEISRLWEAKDDLTAKIVLVMIYTGMRINELFSVTVDDVYLDEQVTEERSVSYIIGGEKTDAGKNRTIVLHSKILPFIREWMAQDGRVYLVERCSHKKMDDHNFRQRDYYPLLERLGIARISPHKARHTFASRGAKAKVEPTVLKNLMGHKNYHTTVDYYTHVDLLQLADGIEMIDK